MLHNFMMVMASTETTLVCLERIKKFCELSAEAPLRLEGDASLQQQLGNGRQLGTKPEESRAGEGGRLHAPLLNLASSQAGRSATWPQNG